MNRILPYLMLLLLVAACSPKIPLRTGMVNCISHDRMTITLESHSQAETQQKAARFAEINALNNLLFKGIPNSNQEKPMIANEQLAKSANTAFFERFIEGNGYQAFITTSQTLEDYEQKKIHFVKQKIIFDLTNLRNHLQSNGVTKKFGL